jgi:5-methylcytosine-specific restriction enzyme subunit McrC
VDVLDGFGMSYSPKKLQAPGFVVDTWKIWEDLVTLALRAEIGSSLVFSQKSERLGTRKSNRNGIGNVGSVWVVPDMKIGGALGQVVDAKYKGRAGEQRIRIAESDLYESLAFATATKQNLVVLLYPAVPADSVAPVVGQTKEFERISVGEVQVIGLEIEVRGISASGAFGQFKKRLADAVRAVKLNL